MSSYRSHKEKTLLEQVERDPDCAFLREQPGWEELRRRYLKN